VFALLGATVDAIQSVGQGKHLKLRLSKGRTPFDAIFFSVTEESCGLHVGDRVDAAFYFQINSFRGSSTLQMQLVDLRPSLFPSRHEAEAISLCRRCRAGEELTAQEIARLYTTREQFGSYWTVLQRHLRGGALAGGTLPILRLLAEEAGGRDSFLRADLALSVFSERGLLELSCQETQISLRTVPVREKVDLNACPYLMRLTESSSSKLR
jgi:single-stranded-DNA-specific exonuclease